MGEDMNFEKLYFTKSQRKIINDWLWDLSIKYKKNLKDIISEIMSKIDFKKNLNKKEAGELFFYLLREKRYPELSKYEKKFDFLKNSLFKNNKYIKAYIDIKHSELFEFDEIFLSIKLTPDNLDDIINFLYENKLQLKKLFF